MNITVEKLQTQRNNRRQQLESALQTLVSMLKTMGAIKIIVFGSFILGSVRRYSDLDIIVIMPSIKNCKEWFKEIYDKIDVPVAVDIFPFTQEEFVQKLHTSSFIRHAIKTGRVVYEKG